MTDHSSTEYSADESPTPALRIFSYLPNPRVWKSLIAADLCGISIEVVGARPAELGTWLWDYDARLLPESERSERSPHARTSSRGFSGTLYKTDRFLQTQPFGTVPAAFSPGGEIGIFESNSILRAVARAGAQARNLYGAGPYEASRIDSFLDANLVFAREAQVYLLSMDQPDAATHGRMAGAYEFYLSGIERALEQSSFISGAELSIADISYVCDFAQFLREGHYKVQLAEAGLELISANGAQRYPKAYEHLLSLSRDPAFSRHMGSYLDWYR